jgi:hypothetical protein
MIKIPELTINWHILEACNVIFTGLLVGTLFTLFVVPMFYSLISRSDVSYTLHRKSVEQTFGAG